MACLKYKMGTFEISTAKEKKININMRVHFCHLYKTAAVCDNWYVCVCIYLLLNSLQATLVTKVEG